MTTTVTVVGPLDGTLATVWQRFTKPEREALLDLLLAQWDFLHMGSLPFMRLDVTIAWVDAVQKEVQRFPSLNLELGATLSLSGRRLAQSTVGYIPILQSKLHVIEREILHQQRKASRDP